MKFWRIPLHHAVQIALWLFILLYIWLFTTLAFDQHMGMRTHKADLGQIDQAVWNSSRGRFVEMTDNGFVATRMTDHVEPILALVSPVFWLWDDVRALLLLQAVFVAVGTWFVYNMAKRTIVISVAMAVAYLLTPQLQSAVLTEFHAAPLAVPLILWAFWAIDRRCWWQALLAIVLTASVKEEMALLAAGLGVWGIWRFKIDDLHVNSPRSPLPAFAGITILCLTWFIIATFIIVPAHAVEVYGTAESSYFQRYGALGNSPLDIFSSFFTQPQVVWQIATEPVRLDYLWYLAAPFGFLSLLAPEILLLSLPLLLANLLSAYPAQYYGEFHYSAPLVPYFVVSAIYGMRRLLVYRNRVLKKKLGFFSNAIFACWILFWAVSTYGQLGRGPGADRYDPTPVNDHHHLLQRLIEQIPADAAVTATAAVHPHVSHRRYVYQFPIGIEAAEWALLDVTTATDMAPGDVKRHVEEMLADDWGVVAGSDGFLLLRQGEKIKQIPEPFYDFARVKMQLSDDEHALDFIDVEVEDWPRWRQTKIVTMWQVGQNFSEKPVVPALEIRTPAGQTLYTLSDLKSPTLLWYPPERWQPNEIIRITSLPLYLPDTWGIVVEETDSWVLVQAYKRVQDDRLFPFDINIQAEFPARGTFRFVTEDGSVNQLLRVQGRLLEPTSWPGGILNLDLRWENMEQWPANLTPFVHLRQGDSNQSQNDGPPRFFVFYDASALLDKQSFLDDRRQLMVPLESDARMGEVWRVVIGLYDPQSGQRADLLNGDGEPSGNELQLGTVRIVSPSIPDQACALIRETCN